MPSPLTTILSAIITFVALATFSGLIGFVAWMVYEWLT